MNIVLQGEVSLRRKAALQRRVNQMKGEALQQEDPVQVKIALQGEVIPSKAVLQRRVVHLKRITLQREDPLLE